MRFFTVVSPILMGESRCSYLLMAKLLLMGHRAGPLARRAGSLLQWPHYSTVERPKARALVAINGGILLQVCQLEP